MLSALVSWRVEPEVNRAYVWLTDGTVIGHRDLDTGLDHPSAPEHAALLAAIASRWVVDSGAPGVDRPRPPVAPDLTGVSRVRRLRRRRLAQEHLRRLERYRSWDADRQPWRIAIDPPHGGWRDLVRNEPGATLWQHAAELGRGAWGGRAPAAVGSWQAGALGEESVAEQLLLLARTGPWRYVHSVPVGSRGADIDHVLVGPAGVLTLNTKSHPGRSIWFSATTFRVDGHDEPYLRNARHEAARASRLLGRAVGAPMSVHPVIVLVRPRSITARNPPRDVSVMAEHDLVRWLAHAPRHLSEPQIDALFAAIRRSTTWSGTGPGLPERHPPA
ncbi:NERD domain-containing protein [Nocardioides sp. TRM66260-LWL]|uniref:nuclease-related domain-containing protein n=1 Tax=Nocardioides sp. TRM66260-LWL TaxID=2874478 RepID=UPI001CC3B6AD|nr:nuclease-related domain-containing protein [Nocardioides sp. TRM66260-LWL]MBZ5735953.1 NERD domain-containing protein [Nocardioides sp. TRM66260-LWL]